MSDPILRPGDSAARDPRRVGGKAAALAAFDDPAIAALIPPWFAIPGDAPIETLAERIVAEAARLGGSVAVRSSALDEDGTGHSFAGQLESHLEVPPEEVPARVAAVRASIRAERVRAYRAARGLEGDPPLPAVLVQRMVPAEFAGVAFAIDPVSGRSDRAVVAAVPGLGESLVSGERDASTVRVDEAGRIVERTTTDDPAPRDEDLIAIAALARRVSALRGHPQDIEWAIADGRLWLLQSRPITTTAPSRDDTLRVWDDSNIAESFGGVTQPLTFSIARLAYAEVYRSFARLMGVSAETIERADAVFENMLGLHRGRVYYNLLNWYRLLAMLPGYRVNRRFMEQMMGVGASLSEELSAAIGANASATTLRDRARLLRSIAGLVRSRLALPTLRRGFLARLEEALREPASTIDALSADELVLRQRALEARLLRRWDAPIVNDFFAMIAHGALRALAARWVDAEDRALANDLVRDVGGIVSVEPARRVQAMAALIAEDRAAVETLLSAPVDEADAFARAHPALGPAYAAYLERFADRCLEELKLETPTLDDDPTSLLRAIGRAAQARASGAVSTPPVASDADARVRSALRGRPLRRWILGLVIREARARMRDRENLRFERTRVFGRARRIMRALGDRLVERGLLDDPRDVFWLAREELFGAVEGTSLTSELRPIVAARTATYERDRGHPPLPERFETRGAVLPLRPVARVAEGPDAPLDDELRRGLGCCAGVVEGIARVVRDPRGVALGPGEILVAERTDPGWVLLFPAARAVVVERGSLLSHSAIVTRELGIPGVVSLPGATRWLRNGDLLRVDGGSGEVRILRRGDALPEAAP